MKAIRVAIADDHRIFLDGVKRLLEDHEDLKVVWTATNGREALKKLEDESADVILLDIQMPELNGIEALDVISKKFTSSKVIILSMSQDKPYIEKVYKLGAHGYLLKNTGNEELIQAIRSVYRGERFFSPEISSALLNNISEKNSPEQLLTKRELEVLVLIAKEYSNPDIAEKLFLSVETVNSHRKNLLRKLDAKNTVGLVKYAIQHGLI